MISSIVRPAAALLGAVIMAVTLGGQPAPAQTASCPCLTSGLVNDWFQGQRPSADHKLLCVDDPGFTTFDYLERSRSLYIDVSYATTHKRASCLVDPSPVVNGLSSLTSRLALSNAQARACRKEILRSRVWRYLGCPNN